MIHHNQKGRAQILSLIRSTFSRINLTKAALDITAAEWLYDFIKQYPTIRKTLDVGFGDGASAITTMLATEHRHTVVEPFSESGFGKKNVENLGLMDRLEFVEETSLLALPKLLRDERTFHTVFIDGGEAFDNLLFDFTFSALLLIETGMMIIPNTCVLMRCNILPNNSKLSIL